MFSGLFSKRLSGSDPSVIGCEELAASVQARDRAVVDVREPNEYADGHVPSAINLPLSRFDPKQLPSGKPVVLICRSGARSAKALSLARTGGRKDVVHYPGGFMGWSRRGGAVAK